jgi:hypothetical protein
VKCKLRHFRDHLTCCLLMLPSDATVSSHVRFRQDYRLERKMLSSLNVDDAAAFLDESTDESTCLRRHAVVSGSQSCRLSSAPMKRSISRVLILHNDKIESFSDSYCTNNACASDFFDTPEFWSGSITWW